MNELKSMTLLRSALYMFKNLKRRILLLWLITFLMGCTVSQAKDRLLVVTDEWAPYVFLENKVVTGFDAEVVTAVLSNMGYEVNFQIFPWKRCIYMIDHQQADAILDIGFEEERKKIMYFPEEQLSESSSVLFHLKGKQYKYQNLQDLQGLTIGTLHGYEYSKKFSEAQYFSKEPVDKEEQNFKKLLLGRIDLFLVNKNVGLFNAKKLGLLDKIEFVPKPVSAGEVFLAFSKKKGYDNLAEDFSRNLKVFKQSPAFKAIMAKYGQ